jgi:uncharacterized Rmd1/YagE family protein
MQCAWLHSRRCAARLRGGGLPAARAAAAAAAAAAAGPGARAARACGGVRRLSLFEEGDEYVAESMHQMARFVVPRSEGMGNVRAYYIAKKISVVPMFQKMYGRQKNWLEVDSLIVSFPSNLSPVSSPSASGGSSPMPSGAGLSPSSSSTPSTWPPVTTSFSSASRAPSEEGAELPASLGSFGLPPPPPAEERGVGTSAGGPAAAPAVTVASAPASGLPKPPPAPATLRLDRPRIRSDNYTGGPGGGAYDEEEGDASALRNQFPPYAVFFDYGAVVFFNCDEVLQTESIAHASKFCEGFLGGGANSGSDDFLVQVDASQEQWSEFKSNRLVLQKLDINNIRVISSVLGQSVALGHFEQVVDGMLQSFEKANNSGEGSGSLQDRRSKTVYEKILRESNNVLSEVIVKLGVLDRTRMRDTAWKYEKYFKIWEGLREEFEIDARWDIMNTKTDYLQHNMRFFVELLHSARSDRLEIIIIVLITLELLVGLTELYMNHAL